ncbi:selenide, water dikinase-like [Cephus cinctus]|uniref:Selenide, water dikinase-like n=1 Tax=Cephus cinctus TaxID=211228 RepID=A0AAJ7VXI2_CEPCN|nr:selenide, water dikinase-like [Cephus cinctus]
MSSKNEEVVPLELVADPLGSVQLPFRPEAHGLSKDFRLSKFGDLRGQRMRLDRAEILDFLSVFNEDQQDRNFKSHVFGEDVSVTHLPHSGLYLVETSNLIWPVIEDPYLLGKIASTCVLSRIYALGVPDCASSRFILGVANRMEENERKVVIPMVIRGFCDVGKSMAAEVRGSEIFSNPWLVLGGTASVVCPLHELVIPDSAILGDVIVLTKPLGTLVAITVAQWMEQTDKRSRLLLTLSEEDAKKGYLRAVDSMIRSNRIAALLMRKVRSQLLRWIICPETRSQLANRLGNQSLPWRSEIPIDCSRWSCCVRRSHPVTASINRMVSLGDVHT